MGMPVVVPLTGPQRNSQVICFVIRCVASSVSKGFPRTTETSKIRWRDLNRFSLVVICVALLFLIVFVILG